MADRRPSIRRRGRPWRCSFWRAPSGDTGPLSLGPIETPNRFIFVQSGDRRHGDPADHRAVSRLGAGAGALKSVRNLLDNLGEPVGNQRGFPGRFQPRWRPHGPLSGWSTRRSALPACSTSPPASAMRLKRTKEDAARPSACGPARASSRGNGDPLHAAAGRSVQRARDATASIDRLRHRSPSRSRRRLLTGTEFTTRRYGPTRRATIAFAHHSARADDLEQPPAGAYPPRRAQVACHLQTWPAARRTPSPHRWRFQPQCTLRSQQPATARALRCSRPARRLARANGAAARQSSLSSVSSAALPRRSWRCRAAAADPAGLQLIERTARSRRSSRPPPRRRRQFSSRRCCRPPSISVLHGPDRPGANWNKANDQQVRFLKAAESARRAPTANASASMAVRP